MTLSPCRSPNGASFRSKVPCRERQWVLMTEQMAICSEGHIRAALMLGHLADARS
jgi:hypothetical protein